MTDTNSSIIEQELNKFAQHATVWWDVNGPLRTLHDINPARLEFISKQLDLRGKRILDVGCGGGILAESMARLGAIVTGIDAECTAVETAKNHAKQGTLSIDYFCKAIEDFEAEAFDAITCMELLEHVKQPQLVIEQCKRLLKPKGLLFLSTINRTSKAYATAILVAEYVLKLLPKQTHDYTKFIKPSELHAMACSLEFRMNEMAGMEYNPFTKQAFLTADVQINYLMSFIG